MDCLSAASDDGVTHFSSQYSEEDIAAWLEEKKARMCEDYHVHDKDAPVKAKNKASKYGQRRKGGKKPWDGKMILEDGEEEWSVGEERARASCVDCGNTWDLVFLLSLLGCQA
jgi:hypothetical protein